MHRKSTLFLLVIAVTGAPLAGCTTPTSGRPVIEAWQQQVTDYVTDKGNGDPNCLRDLVDRRSRRVPRPAAIVFPSVNNLHSYDAHGVLVGHCPSAAGPWYVFLVGIAQNDEKKGSRLEDIRLFAFNADADGLHWTSAPPQPAAVEEYRSARRADRSGPRAVVYEPALPHEPFPSATDVFEMDTAGPEVTVIERSSGAKWRIRLPSATPAEHTADRASAGQRRVDEAF